MKAFLQLIVILLALPCYGQQPGIFLNGKVQNPKGKELVFRKNGTNVSTGERELARYKATINQKGEFKVFLPTANINQWIVEIDDVIRLIDLGTTSNFNIIIATANNYQITVFDEAGNDYNFRSNIAEIVASKFDYEKLQQLKPLQALSFRKDKAALQLSLLADYHKTHQMDINYVQWLSVNYQYEPYERSLVEDRIKLDSLTLLTLTEQGINNDFAAMNSENYNILVQYNVHYKFNKLSFPYRTAQVLESGAKNLSGLTKEVYLTRQLISLSKSPDSIYTPAYAKYSKEILNQTLISLIENERIKFKLSQEASKLSKENITKHAALNDIFKNYKGKVIYVDFWASWCGPCKSEMPNAASLRDKLKGKDIVFVYFGYKDEKQNWLAARKELQIEGEHYLLSEKLIADANAIFEITGIPHYVIIDKDGTIIDKQAPRPSNVYQQLLKLAIAK